MPAEELIERELMMNRFRRLVGELQTGVIRRNHFEPWEIEILLDLETCGVKRRRWGGMLRQYEKAVERQVESGFGPPMKLSEFLAQRAQKRASNF